MKFVPALIMAALFVAGSATASPVGAIATTPNAAGDHLHHHRLERRGKIWEGVKKAVSFSMGHKRADGVRQVSGAVPVDKLSKKILLVTSRKHPGRWILPKGGWEKHETREEAAVRETREEAGVSGSVTRHLGVWDQVNKPHKPPGINCEMAFFELEVDDVQTHWMESNLRQRQWVTYEEALFRLQDEIMREAVRRCSLNPDA
ncbi:NUDIX hydrolase domain-like protein [Dimargaris cristalligena]|uniref:NUDIX hydrolase domain-like protein n=1 Tax=Dimargaris cristalligena TaxID=215637 RepID=A0A4P9ZVX2_9FUNG|nr:NUDIX hydrolase domain-like protein [Dimargaris cristalligena]|eukprot:RKP37796.1 NUDIX hydrolase domain-like protein [Dimargaris cristalligena]